LARINQNHQYLHVFFFLSLPGLLWTSERLLIQGDLGRLFQIAKGETVEQNFIPLAIAFATWLVPFEMSETNMATMKQRIRTYCINTGNKPPVKYTPVDLIVNATMKLLFDKSPLPR
jgi:hypothetical protein